MGKAYLNGTPVEKLPNDTLEDMSRRLSTVVSQYFSAHPDEYRQFLESRTAEKGDEKEAWKT